MPRLSVQLRKPIPAGPHPLAGVAVVCLILGLGTVLTTPCSASAGYDPKADPAADLEAAKARAQTQGKHILLEIGGEWCSWCRLLEKTLKGDVELREALDSRFVVVKVNFSDENPNEAFLSRYPKISGYPHIFVLDASGELLHSQDTGLLEEGRGYSKRALLAFFERWGPNGSGSDAE
ncbi:MAG: thioredoxin family protein [Holophagales bacterium]|nr:thioredoxin family protein [Holophagales bacterium]